MAPKTLTIFTPTFNRAHLLRRTYDSLTAQTSQDFEWLIIDDGSTDNTGALVDVWIQEKKVAISYIYQNNKGMIGAHNSALRAFRTELFLCLDSDDYLPLDAVSNVVSLWEKVKSRHKCGGIVGLDIDPQGKVIGDKLPDNVAMMNFMDIRFKHKVRGDKKYVMSRESIEFAGYYPEIEGEKFPAVSYLYRIMAKKFDFFVYNEPLCIVDYQTDGNTGQKLKQYKRNPNAFMEFRLICMDDPYDLKEKIWSSAHFVSSAINAKKIEQIFLNRHRLFTISAIPLGVGVWIYTQFCGALK